MADGGENDESESDGESYADDDSIHASAVRVSPGQYNFVTTITTS